MASAHAISWNTLNLPVQTMNIYKLYNLITFEDNIIQLVHFSSNHMTHLCTVHTYWN